MSRSIARGFLLVFVAACGKHASGPVDGATDLSASAVTDLGDLGRSALSGPDAATRVDAAAGDMAVGFTLGVGASSDVATYATRSAQGFKFGYADGVLGAVRDGAQYLLFGSAMSATAATCTTGTSALVATPSTQGIYTLITAGSDPTGIGAARCAALLSPEGDVFDGGTNGAFDRNYLGGGPVLRIKSADGTKTGILAVFHSEFQWGPTCAGAPCFYGTLGMGLSTDDGNSMQRLGQIIQPHPARPDWIALGSGPLSLSIGNGPFVLGDIDAHPVDPRTADPTTSYLYVFYPDYQIVGSNAMPGLAVARALMADVIAAAFANATSTFPTLFHKYYNPTGALAVRNAFTEPGVSTDVANNGVASGNFTPILTKAFSPSAMYDASIGRAILASTTTNATGVRIIELRTSGADLVSWPATAAATIDESPTNEVRYPSLIGDATDPAAGLLSPYLFYSHEPVATPTWPNTTLVVRRLQLTIN